MAEINVALTEQDGGWVATVTVTEGGSKTTHEVALARVDYERLAGGRGSPEELVLRSFEFLLEREPKESILRRFELPVIGRYFPEYAGDIGGRMG